MSNCNIVRDLIPLVTEQLTTDDSKTFVEQHLSQCDACRAYAAQIQQDVEQASAHAAPDALPDSSQLDTAITKLARYQKRMKLAAVLLAMLLSCVVLGGGVQFLSTLPLLVIIPFLCRLYYKKSWPILISSIPFGIIGGSLNGNGSYIGFFTFIALFSTFLGVLAGRFILTGLRQSNWILKSLLILCAAVLLYGGSALHFSFNGNPIGYIQTANRAKAYVDKTYEEGTLTYKGVGYNFKFNQHYARYEYILNGIPQTASITFYKDGTVWDDYQERLNMQFYDDRSADLKMQIAAALQFEPFTVYASRDEQELHITRYELDDVFNHLSYDRPRQLQAAKVRLEESKKLTFYIEFNRYNEEELSLSKKQFMEISTIIFKTLQAQSVPYHQIVVSTTDQNGAKQTVAWEHTYSEQQMLDSYQMSQDK